MENQEMFQMTYSAQEQEEIRAIREKYMPKTESKMDKLRALDGKVNRKATSLSITIGVVGSLIMGAGMSLIMTDLGAAMGALAFPIGILMGLVGIGILALAYPVYQWSLKKERKKVAEEILRLADELSQ